MSNLAEVDNLEIKVEATSRGANQQLKILIGMMDELSAKLNGMNTKNFESLATLMKSLSSMAGSVKNASNSIKEANKNIGDISETSKKAKKVLDDLFANSDKIGRNIPMPKGIIEQQNELKKLESEYDRLLQRQEKYVYTGNSMESKSWVNLQYDIIKTQNRMEDLKQSIESTKAKANEEIQFNVTVPNFDNEKFDLSDLILSQNTLGLEKTFENFHTTVNNVFSDVRSDIDSVISKTVDLSNIDVSSVFQNMKIKDNAPAEVELIVGKYNKLREELLELENIYNDVAESSKNFTDAEQGETPVNVAQQTVERIQEVVAQMTSLRQSAKAINESIAKPFENLVDTSYLSEMNIKQLKEELKNTSAELERINSQVSSWKDKSGNIDFNAVDNDALEELLKRIDNDLSRFINEADKLILYKNHIDIIDVNTMVSPTLEDDVFHIANALLQGENSLALASYRDLRLTSPKDVDRLIPLLASQFRFAEQVLFLSKQGLSNNEIATELNVKPFRVGKTLSNKKHLSLKRIYLALDNLFMLDWQIKSGQIDRYYGIELFLINF